MCGGICPRNLHPAVIAECLSLPRCPSLSVHILEPASVPYSFAWLLFSLAQQEMRHRIGRCLSTHNGQAMSRLSVEAPLVWSRPSACWTRVCTQQYLTPLPTLAACGLQIQDTDGPPFVPTSPSSLVRFPTSGGVMKRLCSLPKITCTRIF